MALYAIGDLHLSGSVDKPMDIFGTHWCRHAERIAENWRKTVTENDTVLLAGDISWAMTLDEALVDLEWIHALPGRKMLVRGNHDYWWKSITRLNQFFNEMDFIQNNFFCYGDYAVCGSRGWLCPNDTAFSEHDRKIYQRELQRLELSLSAAEKAGYTRYIVMLHYPPTNDQGDPSGFTDIIQRYQVSHVIYGHLHGAASFAAALQGQFRGTVYHLVSCDYLNFKLKEIIPD